MEQDQLGKILTDASDSYYAGKPTISDDEFDALLDLMQVLYPDDLFLQSVGANITSGRLKKVSHTIPMWSLKKGPKEDVSDWFSEMLGKQSSKFILLSEKLDGLSVELVYKNGTLVCAITRGDGEIGENITHNVIRMQNVKSKILGFTGSLRGEIILENSKFKKYLKDEDYKNTRNASAGIARSKDPSDYAQYLKVLYFDCIIDNAEFDFHRQKLEFIESLGLEAAPTQKCKSWDTAQHWYDFYDENGRKELDYEIDGLVLHFDDLELQETLGVNRGRPRYAIAWKFAPQAQKTVLRGISWRLGKTGRVTPVALVDPIDIGGATVRQATLHVASQVRKKGYREGDELLVSRRGDVIPYVEAIITHGDGDPFEIPTECPSCGEELHWDGELLLCTNLECNARQLGTILRWIQVLKLDSMGPAFVDAVVSSGLVSTPGDLYRLTVGDISAFSGYQQKSAEKIVTEIKSKMDVPFENFFGGLNIPNVSATTFDILRENGFDSVEKISAGSYDDFVNIQKVGPITAQTLVDELSRLSTVIQDLLDVGVRLTLPTVGNLTGQSFCFTGEISIRRGEAQKLVKDQGGTVKSGVSKGLNYLVQSDPSSKSGKTKKADKYGTKVIGEDEFFELVGFLQ